MSATSVLIIGGGLAGVSAAIEAYNDGAEVTLVEKNPKLGGNSQYASSGINAVNSKAQVAQGIKDTKELFEADTNKAGRGKCVPKLVSTLVEKSADAIEFLAKYGVDTSVISLCGGHSASRTHRAKPRADGKLENMGGHIMKALIAHVDTLDKTRMRILLNTQASNLLINDKRTVVGVRCTQKFEAHTPNLNLFADSVILTTGGFSASDELLGKYATEQVSKLPTTNGPFARGEGVTMAEEIGAKLIDMKEIQVHPTGIIHPKKPFERKKFLAPEAFRGYGGILVNNKGQRFVDELTYRDVVSNAIFKHCQKYDKFDTKPDDGQILPIVCYLLLTEEMAAAFGAKLFSFYRDRIGLITECADAAATATFIGCKEEALKDTLAQHAKAAKEGNDPFGKTKFYSPKDGAPLTFDPAKKIYVVMTTPSIHYTMGGVQFNEQGSVLDADGKVIKGFYAAGEATGGVHGNNRLGGNSLLECVVFGRIAGASAAQHTGDRTIGNTNVKPDFVDENGVFHQRALHPDKFVPLTLQSKVAMNEHNVVFTFAFPDPANHAGMYTGQYIAVRALLEGEQVVRYYSPISRNAEYGTIKLLVKIEKAKLKPGSMTNHFNDMKVGDKLEFQGPLGGLEYHRLKWKNVGMIAGGTGISPMVQIINSAARHPEDTTQFTLLYGNMKEEDILCRDILMYYTMTRTNIDMFITLLEPPQNWTMGTGFITKEMIEKHMPPPADDTIIVLCGPPVMIKVMKGYLSELKYTPSMIFSYV